MTTPTIPNTAMRDAMTIGGQTYRLLSAAGKTLVDYAPTPAYLALVALERINDPISETVAPFDPTRWETCVGGFIARNAGFQIDHHLGLTCRPPVSHTTTGDNLWHVCAALLGAHRTSNGYSLFAPEATLDEVTTVLERIAIAEPQRITA